MILYLGYDCYAYKRKAYFLFILWLKRINISILYLYLMPKYVLKEDVEKGLVDPTKSLDQQPEYKHKMQKEALDKNKLKEEHKPQNFRPKKERPPRNPIQKFNWNKQDITQETKAPEGPKKILDKPSKERYNQGLQKLKAQREVLKEERKNLIDEQRSIIRDITQSKKTGRMAITQYSGAMRQKFNIESQLRKQIRALDDVKKRVNNEIESLSYRFNELRQPTNNQNNSIQLLHYRISQKEHELTTGDINKRQEARLYNEINQLKRALQKAKPNIEIQSQLGKLKDNIDILYKELKAIKTELHYKITQANELRYELDVLKEQKKNQEGSAAQQKTIEQIKQEYDEKIKAVDQKRDKLQDRIDDYIDKYNRDYDDYEDQQDLLNYISWVKQQQERIHQRKEQEERRKKENQEYEKRKLKQKEDYQKRKEERRKYEEQRKIKEQQRKVRLQKERQAYLNRNPNHIEIQLCETLISYCNNLRPSETKVEEKQSRAVEQIKLGKEWQKELKGGAQIIKSKKSKEDEQIPKKPLKNKKKEQRPESQEFNHGIQAVNQFQKLQLLPPANAKEIDQAIKFIQQKLSIYNNPTEQQRAAFKEKAARQFDEKNGFGNQDKHKGAYREKYEEAKPNEKIQRSEKPKRKQKKELSEQDFPGLSS